jgi:hypothetical protein
MEPESIRWLILIAFYLLLALGSFVPTIQAFRKFETPFEPGSDFFGGSTYFSDEAKLRLQQHNDRMIDMLGFWKKQVKQYRRLHYYIVIWVLISSTLVPILTQAITDNAVSKLLLTIISVHTTVMLGLHRILKVDENIQEFRRGESQFYDLRRRLLDRPKSFGETEVEQLDNYFMTVEQLRQTMRGEELGNIPSVEEATARQLMTDARNAEVIAALSPQDVTPQRPSSSSSSEGDAEKPGAG